MDSTQLREHNEDGGKDSCGGSAGAQRLRRSISASISSVTTHLGLARHRRVNSLHASELCLGLGDVAAAPTGEKDSQDWNNVEELQLPADDSIVSLRIC